MPEISIIVPVYKVESYLNRCVDSILAQTFKDFELILVDDGSPDNCPIICDKYVQNDIRCSVLHLKNGGQSHARNAALSVAKGKYIGFVDSDDWIMPDMYEYLHDFITRTGADVVSADYAFTDGKGILQQKNFFETVINGSDNILEFYLSRDKMHGKNDFPVWIKLYKRDFFTEIKFPEGKIYEDNITNFKILSKCKKYAKSSKIVYAYFQRPESTTKTMLTAKHLSLISVSKEMLTLAKTTKITNLCKRKLAMSYFSVLAMYVRYGTDLTLDDIKKLLSEYKTVKKDFLKYEKRPKIHIISFLMCTDIKKMRDFYQKLFSGKTNL